MAFEVESGLVFNSIFWLTSPRPSEVNMVEDMMDDVSVVCLAKKIPFKKYIVPSSADLIRALGEIEEAARRGMKPLIYLDMHGSATDGVEIAATNEMVSWDRVVDALRAINRATGNNLLVVAGVCYGLYAIRETIIADHAPFYMLIAPEEKITFGELINQTFLFFQELVTNLDVVMAAEGTLSPKMKVFHCMRMFTVAMAKYIRRNCQGKGAAVRREYLLSEVIKSGAPMPPGGLAELRKQIKKGIAPSQEMLDKFSARFLGGKPLGYISPDCSTRSKRLRRPPEDLSHGFQLAWAEVPEAMDGLIVGEADLVSNQAPCRPHRRDRGIDQPDLVRSIHSAGKSGDGRFADRPVVRQSHVAVLENQNGARSGLLARLQLRQLLSHCGLHPLLPQVFVVLRRCSDGEQSAVRLYRQRPDDFPSERKFDAGRRSGPDAFDAERLVVFRRRDGTFGMQLCSIRLDPSDDSPLGLDDVTRLQALTRIDFEHQIEPPGRRHVAIQRGDDRVDERLEIDVRSHLLGERFYDRVLDCIRLIIDFESVFDLRLPSEIFRRMGIRASGACEFFQGAHDRVAGFALVFARPS